MNTPYDEREERLRQLQASSRDNLLRGEFEVAESTARELLTLAENTSETWLSWAHLCLGTVLENVGRYDEALHHAEAAQAVAPVDDPIWFRAATLIGNVYRSQGDYPAAQKQYQCVLEFNPNLSFALCSLAATKLCMGNIECAREYGVKALTAARDRGDREHITVAFNLLGDAEMDSGNTTKAENYFRNSLAISEEIGRRRGISISSQWLMQIECDRENYAAGLQHGQRAVRVETEMDLGAEIANVSLRVVSQLVDAKSPEVLSGAITLCQTALEAAIEPATKVEALQCKAWLHRKLDQFDQSEQSLNEAMNYLQDHDEEMARTHGLIGITYHQHQRTDAARTSFVKSLELAEQHGHIIAQQNAHSSLAKIALDEDDAEQACYHYRIAIDLAKRAGDQDAMDNLSAKLKRHQPNSFSRLVNWLCGRRVA